MECSKKKNDKPLSQNAWLPRYFNLAAHRVTSALNKDFFIFLAWKSIEKYFSTSQKFIQNNFSDQKSIEKYFSISQKFIQNNFSYQKSIEKYFFNSLKFISMIFSDQKIIR